MASIISAGTTAGTALNFTGDTTGNLAFQTQAGANTITVPNGTGTVAVQGVSSNIVSGTAQTVSGVTSVNFTGIPSWIKRLTIQLYNVSLTSTSPWLTLRFGNNTYDTTSYIGTLATFQAGVTINSPTTSFYVVNPGTTASAAAGNVVLTNLAGTNTWIVSGTLASNNDGRSYSVNGSHTTTGTLNQLQFVPSDGTTTFSGTFNILYE